MSYQDMIGQTAAKQMSDRYQQYPSGAYMPEMYAVPYAQEPAQPQYIPPSHSISSKHYGSHSGGHKNSAAMSALTLLAFLFFLNILQQCLKDHMTAMSSPPIMIMSGGREGEELLSKTREKKIDKAGQVKLKPSTDEPNPTKQSGRPSVQDLSDDKFTEVNLDKPPRDREGFVSAMTADRD